MSLVVNRFAGHRSIASHSQADNHYACAAYGHVKYILGTGVFVRDFFCSRVVLINPLCVEKHVTVVI